MCGIVGLFAKTPRYEKQLGHYLSEMLETMTDRGPDSAGFAVYGDQAPGQVRLTLRLNEGEELPDWLSSFEPVVRSNHAVVKVPEDATMQTARDLRAAGLTIVGVGSRMELYKGVGLPRAVCSQFGLADMAATHGLGHTRMATESAVTTDGAHPFNTGPDLCLVHNGSLSNHASLRRVLSKQGIQFETQNDSEVAAGYLNWRMNEGDGLKEALEHALDDLDGFFTFVVGTERGLGVLRDPIACKPAVMCETDDLIAFGSEYRALAMLPDVDNAHVWEPEPATVYFWERAA